MFALPDLIIVSNGRLDPREAAIRVKGEATYLHFLTSSESGMGGWTQGRLYPREAAIRVKGEATFLHFLTSSESGMGGWTQGTQHSGSKVRLHV